VLRSQGWTGLYKGLEAKLTQTVATAALMFLIYEKIASMVFRVMRPRTNLGLTKTAWRFHVGSNVFKCVFNIFSTFQQLVSDVKQCFILLPLLQYYCCILYEKAVQPAVGGTSTYIINFWTNKLKHLCATLPGDFGTTCRLYYSTRLLTYSHYFTPF